MKREKILMGMTIKIEIAEHNASEDIFEKVFSYFEKVDRKFSTYKKDSEISKINSGEIKEADYSPDMKEIFKLAEETKKNSYGYFNIQTPENILDPSGIVKGWAIKKAAEILKEKGFNNFYIDAGGDIQVSGKNKGGKPWQVGIRNPLKIAEVVKIISVKDKGVATSGTYVRGQHIYNPIREKSDNGEILSLTVIGPDIYEADRFATAAFAMGKEGIFFIENLPDFEAYMIDRHGIATMSSGFEKYVV